LQIILEGEIIMTTITTQSADTTKAKQVNYTAELTAKIVTMYQAGTSPDVIGQAVGKKTSSIIAKLSREKVYVPKAYVSKTGTKPVTREELVSQIVEQTGIDSETLTTLAKANKGALLALVEYFNDTKPVGSEA
jgi:hypothetical protein